MTSRSIFGVLAVISGFVGLVCGVSEWFLQIMILPEIDWAEPFMSLANLCWLGHIFFFGVGICFAGLAAISSGKSLPAPTPAIAQPVADAPPPPLPAKKPAEPARKAESDDLWQAESAPFPKPGKIEHPDEDENLWQAESAPFPKVEIPEEAEAEAKAAEDAQRKD